MSLKSKLFKIIKIAYPDYISYERAEQIAKEDGRRPDNMTRRMRELTDGDKPIIEKIKSEKGHIIGYKYNPKNDLYYKIEPISTQDRLFKLRIIK